MKPQPCPNYPPAERPGNEPCACFLQRRDQIAAWLQSGYSIKDVWTACRRATPPFEASYQTFWRYCRQHGLSMPRGAPPEAMTKPISENAIAPKRSAPLESSPQVWPRVPGKPREFIPRTED